MFKPYFSVASRYNPNLGPSQDELSIARLYIPSSASKLFVNGRGAADIGRQLSISFLARMRFPRWLNIRSCITSLDRSARRIIENWLWHRCELIGASSFFHIVWVQIDEIVVVLLQSFLHLPGAVGSSSLVFVEEWNKSRPVLKKQCGIN